MGHTQWMPEVWLNVGIDYDGDGKVYPFGKPDDALGSTREYLVNRGKYRRGEHWGYEVRAPASAAATASYAAWASAGVTRADGQPFPQPNLRANSGAGRGRPGVPARPELLCGEDLQSVDELCAGDRASRRPRARRAALHPAVPGSERAPTLAEVQEMQTRLTKAGFDTGGTDGRVGNMTMLAADFQQKAGLAPADGYPG